MTFLIFVRAANNPISHVFALQHIDQFFSGTEKKAIRVEMTRALLNSKINTDINVDTRLDEFDNDSYINNFCSNILSWVGPLLPKREDLNLPEIIPVAKLENALESFLISRGITSRKVRRALTGQIAPLIEAALRPAETAQHLKPASPDTTHVAPSLAEQEIFGNVPESLKRRRPYKKRNWSEATIADQEKVRAANQIVGAYNYRKGKGEPFTDAEHEAYRPPRVC